MDLYKLEIIIQLCRMQIQREREKLAMTPKMRGALESLKKLQSYADDEADKLSRRINGETMPALTDAMKGANANVDAMHGVVDDINNFADEIKKTNGGDPLSDDYGQRGPRSSEVAGK